MHSARPVISSCRRLRSFHFFSSESKRSWHFRLGTGMPIPQMPRLNGRHSLQHASVEVLIGLKLELARLMKATFRVIVLAALEGRAHQSRAREVAQRELVLATSSGPRRDLVLVANQNHCAHVVCCSQTRPIRPVVTKICPRFGLWSSLPAINS